MCAARRSLLAGFGAAYGTAKSGVGIASMGVMRPELVMKSIVPVVMAGVLGIYGLIIAVIISTNSELEDHVPWPAQQCQRHIPAQLALAASKAAVVSDGAGCSARLRCEAWYAQQVRACTCTFWQRHHFLKPHPSPVGMACSQPDGRQGLLLLRRLRALCCRPGMRPCRPGCRHGHRHRGRRRRAGQRAAAQAVCRHDPHPHFRRGARAVRPYR